MHNAGNGLVDVTSSKDAATKTICASVSSLSPFVIAKLPYLPTLKTSIQNAVPRPVTPFYPAVTKAIEDNAYAAIKGDKTVAQALKDMQAAIQSAGS